MTSLPVTNAASNETPGVTVPSLIDVAAERRRTAGSTRASHFNAAGSALTSVGIVTAVVDHLRREELRGGYEAATEVAAHVEAVYESAATVIGAQPHEIALIDSASTGLRTIVDALRILPGQRIIASTSTYVSHALHLMSVARERDIPLVIAPADERRRVDLGALEDILSDGIPTIVSIAHIPTSSGLVEPIVEIGALVRRFGGTYILDATQSVGHLEIDVTQIGCDVLVTTGRKFLRAPRGTGFAYVSSALCAVLEPIAPDVRGARWTSSDGWDLVASARRFETWESSVAGRLGLGVALDEALARGVKATEEWLIATSAELRASLASIGGVRVTDPPGSESAIITFEIDGWDPARTVRELAERDVRVVSVPATHGQWDLGDRGITSVVRASPHVYNDSTDVEALLDGVASVAGSARIDT